jgi:hypothetical protein
VTLTVGDTRAIAVLINGGTNAQAAEAAGYSERTVRRHRDWDPEFKAALEQAQADALDRVRYAMTGAAAHAVRTLLQAATNADGTVPWPTRVAAAGKLVELTVGKWITVTGPGGGPVEVTAVSPQEELFARLERLAPQPVIDTIAEEPEELGRLG